MGLNALNHYTITPVDLEADYDLPCWAGVVPLRLVAGTPEPDPRLRSGAAPPPARR